MAKKAKRLAESWSYVPRGDRTLPVEEQTTFRLRPMSQAERLAANDDVKVTTIEADGAQTVTGREWQVALRLCRQHIEEISNFPAGEAQPWPVDREMRERYLEQLDDALIRELGNEIFTRSGIGELEKN